MQYSGLHYVMFFKTLILQFYFDNQYQVVRGDYLDYSIGPVAYIQDFNIDVIYYIAKDYQNCSILPLEYNDDTAPEAIVSSSGDLQLGTAQQLFLASNEYNYSYQGVANVRGAEVDSWISLRDFEAISPSYNWTNVVYQIFFTRPGFTVFSDFSTTTEPAIWQLRIQATTNYIDDVSGQPKATNLSLEYNIFGYSPDEPDLDIYDSSLCLNSSESTILNFAIVSNDTLRIPPIRRAVRNALTKYVQTIEMPFVSSLQISSVQVSNSSNYFFNFALYYACVYLRH